MLTVTSPPSKEVCELAQQSMCIGGDVNNQRVIREFINTNKLFDR